MLALSQRYPSPQALHKAGAKRLTTRRETARLRGAGGYVAQGLAAMRSQTVSVAGSKTAACLVAELAAQAARVLARRANLAEEAACSPSQRLRWCAGLPGVGPRIGAGILIESGVIRRFP